MSLLDPGWVLDLRIAALLAVLGAASCFDWVRREVSDNIWVIGGVVGLALLLSSAPGNDLPLLALYVLVGAFVIQHFLPWDEHVGDRPWVVLGLEGGLYAGVVLAVVWAYFDLTPGPSVDVYAAVISVLFSRALFESGLLYGGADAKSLMAAGLLLPVGPLPLLVSLPPTLSNMWLQNIPFPFTMLVDGAVASLVGPVVILALNLSRGEHRLPRAFYLYQVDTKDLPKKFVWLKEPEPEPRPKEETTQEDIELREAQAKELLAKGVDRVWVTPQLPFLIPLAIGAVLGLLGGNILLWALAMIP